MSDQELRKLLEQLQSEMEATQSVDEMGRELLRRLDADIHELLERSGESSRRPRSSMLLQLQDGIDYFEATHPRLTAVLSQMLNSLNNAGI